MYIPEAWCKLFHQATPRLIIYYAYNYYNIPWVTVNDMSTESITLQKKKHLNTYNESEIILTILKCIPTHRIKYGSQIGPFG